MIYVSTQYLGFCHLENFTNKSRDEKLDRIG